MNRPQVVSEQERQAARDALLVKEKEGFARTTSTDRKGIR